VVLAAAVLGAALLLPWHVRAAGSAPSFTSAQVSAGSKYFEATCSPCHGANLEGGAGPALTGPAFKTLSDKVKASIGDIFTYMSTNMPLNNPASLTHDQYVSIMAFILSKNGYKPGSGALTFAAASNSSAPPLNPH
jgi:polar amino acid transport system substrate-binding protein